MEDKVTSALITSDMMQPLVNTIQSNVATLLPVGITLMSILVAVGLIPRIVYKFL